jgi:hypothetical protein
MATGLRIGIVLSGTAPAMTLMSGAMLAFAERNVTFDVISTTGVGGLIGLLSLAPRGQSPRKALEALPNLYVSDWIHRFFPVNFKTFHKHGPFAPRFYEARKKLPRFEVAPDEPAELRRLFNDWVQLWATALTPTSLDIQHKGLMSHVPLVDDLVDFDKLKAAAGATTFYLNAFSLWTRRLRIFDNQTVTPDVYNGAQAMFMLFPPVRIGPDPATGVGSDLLTTGATRDPTGLQAIWTRRPQLDAVLVLDPVTQSFWREPENAYDAFQLMLMNPIATLQQLMLAFYSEVDHNANQKPWPAPALAGVPVPRLYGIPLPIEPSYYPRMLDWTHTNAITLQKIGYEAARPFATALATASTDVERMSFLESFRLFQTLLQPRSRQFLRLFAPTFEHFEHFERFIHVARGFGEVHESAVAP